MVEGDWLTPLAAGVVGVQADLPKEERVALTAAALVLNGPLALAPMLVAVERHRAALAAGAADPPNAGSGSTPAGPIGATLVEVPDLIGWNVEEAKTALKEQGFKVARPRYFYSKPEEKDLVIDQLEPPEIGSLVEQGKATIELKVGAGVKPEAPATDDLAAITALRADVDGRLEQADRRADARHGELAGALDRIGAALDRLNGRLDGLAGASGGSSGGPQQAGTPSPSPAKK